MDRHESTPQNSPLNRRLEPELMDSPADAQAYDAMDHAEVNRWFADDLTAALADWRPPRDRPVTILDLGTGTARIPLEICAQLPVVCVLAVDAAGSMLDVARENVERAGLAHRISLQQVDVKSLPFADGQFSVVTSNSLLHHIAEPAGLLAEAIRVTEPGGLLFMRDLYRPVDEHTRDQLVAQHASEATDEQQKMLADSLRAALTPDEVRELVASFGFDRATVQVTSDRHWTWTAVKRDDR